MKNLLFLLSLSLGVLSLPLPTDTDASKGTSPKNLICGKTGAPFKGCVPAGGKNPQPVAGSCDPKTRVGCSNGKKARDTGTEMQNSNNKKARDTDTDASKPPSPANLICGKIGAPFKSCVPAGSGNVHPPPEPCDPKTRVGCPHNKPRDTTPPAPRNAEPESAEPEKAYKCGRKGLPTCLPPKATVKKGAKCDPKTRKGCNGENGAGDSSQPKPRSATPSLNNLAS